MDVEGLSAEAEFARISADLLAERDETVALQLVVDHAVEVVAACDFCGISLRHGNGRIETAASTSSIAIECDALQYELGEGPCLDAAFEAGAYAVEDTSSDMRWPTWGPMAAAKGAWSMFAVQLFADSWRIGALNLYAIKPFAFTSADRETALIYGGHASSALSVVRRINGLEVAVENRHQIGVAQGVIMNRYGVTTEQSFQILRRYSSQTNTKLREVARRVVETGALPETLVIEDLDDANG